MWRNPRLCKAIGSKDIVLYKNKVRESFQVRDVSLFNGGGGGGATNFLNKAPKKF